MKHLLHCTAVPLALAVIFSASCVADDGSRLLSKYDLNGDLSISQDEIKSKKLNVFRYLDNDKDGSVSFSEYESSDAARRVNLLKSRFAKIDSDSDGIVTEAEYSHFLGQFESLDVNGDGSLSSEEVNVAEADSNANNHCLFWFCFRTTLD